MPRRTPSYNIYRTDDDYYKALPRVVAPHLRGLTPFDHMALEVSRLMQQATQASGASNQDVLESCLHQIVHALADWRFSQEVPRVWFIAPELLQALDEMEFDVRFCEATSPLHQVSIAFPARTGYPGVLMTDFRTLPADDPRYLWRMYEDIRAKLAPKAMSIPKSLYSFFLSTSGFKGRRDMYNGTWEGESQKIRDTPLLFVNYRPRDRVSNKLQLTVLRIMAYVRAFPHALREGFPPLQRKEGAGYTIGVSDELQAAYEHRSVSGTKGSPSVHFRRGHLRALRDERFKRDESGNVRIIWVKPTCVAGEMAPYTVDRLEE